MNERNILWRKSKLQRSQITRNQLLFPVLQVFNVTTTARASDFSPLSLSFGVDEVVADTIAACCETYYLPREGHTKYVRHISIFFIHFIRLHLVKNQ